MQKSDPNAPPLRHHKSTDRAYAVDPATRKFIYFDAWGSRAASEAYKRWLIALDGPSRLTVRRRKRSHDVTVDELIEKFVEHITPRHQKAVITSTRCATNVLDELYGSTAAADFEPLDLVTVSARGRYADESLVHDTDRIVFATLMRESDGTAPRRTLEHATVLPRGALRGALDRLVASGAVRRIAALRSTQARHAVAGHDVALLA